MKTGFVLFALTISPEGVVPASVSDRDLPALAEHSFATGVKWRNDSAVARPHFRGAARLYDELWRRGHRNPDLALNRANAHRLAGDLPAAVVSLKEGLAAAPWNRPLQESLEDARSAVGYPLVGDLAAQCRPAPAVGVATRMTPGEAWAIAGALWLLTCAAAARFAMTRRPAWLLFAAACAAGLAVLGGLWWRDGVRRVQQGGFPVVVLADDATLRTGNADSYPPRLEPKLPPGVEARELSRRGGWAQVRLAGGAVGWLPEAVLLPVNDGTNAAEPRREAERATP